MKRIFNLLVAGVVLFCSASLVQAQVGSPIPQPQLSPYLYLNQGGPQGYLNYRQALDIQNYQQPPLSQQQRQALSREYNNTTQFQATPATTGFNQTLHATGHADTRGTTYNYMNFSHYYNVRPPYVRPSY